MFRNALWCGNVPSCTLFRKDDELSEFFGVIHSGQPPPQPDEPNPSKRRRPRNNRIRIRSAAAPGPKLVDYFSQTRHQVGGGDQGPQAGPCIGCFPTTGRAQRIASSFPNSKGVSGQATKQSRLDSRPKAPQNGHGHCSVPGIGGALGAQMSGRGLGNLGWRDPATGWNFQRWNGTLKCLEEDSPLRIRWRLHSF